MGHEPTTSGITIRRLEFRTNKKMHECTVFQALIEDLKCSAESMNRPM